jgi:hypothetical protein
MIDLGADVALNVDGQQAFQKQLFTNGDLEGTIYRFGGGASIYFPAGSNKKIDLNDQRIFAKLGGMWENRAFVFNPNQGKKLTFGNDALHIVGGLGYVNHGDVKVNEDDNKVVELENELDFFSERLHLYDTKIYATAALGAGKMTGEIPGNYNSFRLTATAYQRILDRLSIAIGGGYQTEDLGSNWTNKGISGEINPQFGIFDGKATLGLAGTYRQLESIVNNKTSTSDHWGIKATFEAKPTHWLKVGAHFGYEFPSKDSDGLGVYGGLGATIALPTTKRHMHLARDNSGGKGGD